MVVPVMLSIMIAAATEAGAVSLSAGYCHSCVLNSMGEPVCWGANDKGQAAPPPGLWLSTLSAGALHTCGLTAGPVQSVHCWGSNEYDQARPPKDTPKLRALAAGLGSTCGLDDEGSPFCWGIGVAGEGQPPKGLSGLRSITAGYEVTGLRAHYCAINATGSPVCWGSNDVGQAAAPPGTPALVTLSAGECHTCGLDEGGSPICWGAQKSKSAPPDVVLDAGQLQSPPLLQSLVSISAGLGHTCAVDEFGRALCWGASFPGLDHGQANPPEEVELVVVSSGAYHTCGIDINRTVVCWGENHQNQSSPPDHLVVSCGPGAAYTGTARCELCQAGREPDTRQLHCIHCPVGSTSPIPGSPCIQLPQIPSIAGIPLPSMVQIAWIFGYLTAGSLIAAIIFIAIRYCMPVLIEALKPHCSRIALDLHHRFSQNAREVPCCGDGSLVWARDPPRYSGLGWQHELPPQVAASVGLRASAYRHATPVPRAEDGGVQEDEAEDLVEIVQWEEKQPEGEKDVARRKSRRSTVRSEYDEEDMEQSSSETESSKSKMSAVFMGSSSSSESFDDSSNSGK
eukprot:gnl/MRDRNA2_/MRDRNA2_54787_c0_seq1.p1 gnl/MRDRNA2_/MRDRNA2_54787_c0~~gnl/MRDRNA2_/MRDRNA2_54787_c0_seq1.p1  ORF type:complete len:568 (+),score=86.75 gnl/MRDRNA2_/MRDRNA2_54787_c0_seq1:134-1837(+)